MAHFESGGISIAYDDIGPRGSRAIVLVHGFATNRFENWRRLGWYGAFERKGFRVVAMDCRGHGESTKPVSPDSYVGTAMVSDILALMDHLALTGTDLMGYSMGARLALAAACEQPERIRHLVLGGVGQRLLEPAPKENRMAEAMEAGDPESISDPILRSFRHFADEQGANRLALAALSRANRDNGGLPDFSRVAAPVLVVAGARDTLAGDPEPLAAKFPHGRAVTLAACDHFSAIPHALFKATVFDFLGDMLE